MVAGTAMPRSASSENRADGDHTPALPPLGEEALDHRLGGVVLTLADVAIADDAVAIHQERGRPSDDTPPFPDRELVVLHDRLADTELLRGLAPPFVRLLPPALCSVAADDGEAVLFVTLVPAPHLRDHVSAVDSAVGPELNEHHAASQTLHGQGPAVDPAVSRHLGRRRADAQGLGRGGSIREARQERREQERAARPHDYRFSFGIVLSSFIIILSSLGGAIPSRGISSFFMPSSFWPLFIVPLSSPFIIVSSFFGLSLWAEDSPIVPASTNDSPATT